MAWEGRGNDGKFFSLNDVPLRVRVRVCLLYFRGVLVAAPTVSVSL